MPALDGRPPTMRLPIRHEASKRFRRKLGTALVALLAPFLLAGASDPVHLSFLNPQGPVAAAQRTHIFVVMLIVCIVVVPVFILTPRRYRYGNASASYTPRWASNRPLELVIWGVPLAIVIVLAIWLARDVVGLDPYAPLAPRDPPLKVEVVGYDWKWLFVYPDYKIASMGELAFPAEREVSFRITSNTVLQSFFISALGSQIYAMPGMVTQLHLLASSPGRFLGQNTQYNGDGFAQQKFLARAMSDQDFDAWVRRVQATGIPMTPAAYRAVQSRSTLDSTVEALGEHGAPPGVIYFRDVSPSLFSDIVQSFHGTSHRSAMRHGETALTRPE